ncbi:MAG: tripartite tricarboxylate transporter substrate binding protein [Lachnospiraceae bacterium]|nr:tripartite tricarboxylate transporter substrate binding protein [Lachnospiraceae bacterium]
MKKRVLATVLAGVAVLSLAGCGGGSETAATTAATTAAAAEGGAAEGGAAGGDAAAATDLGETSWAPSTTVSIVVPAGAGGNTDLSARVFAQYAKELTGADFIVVNANGASGSVAANQVLSAAPDGHTFLYGHNLVNVANIAGITDYNYSAFKLGPTFAKDPAQQLYVNPEKYADLDAFIEAAKAAPGQLKACTEVGAYTYYEILAFQKAAGIELDLVDVGSNSDKIAAMLSGQVDLMPGAYINCKDYLAAGQFACIGVPTEERYDLIPDIPTFKEQGIDLVYPDCDFSFYFPAETPDDVIVFYENLVQQILADPAAAEGVAGVDMMPYYLNAADSAAHDEEIFNTIKGIADELAK